MKIDYFVDFDRAAKELSFCLIFPKNCDFVQFELKLRILFELGINQASREFVQMFFFHSLKIGDFAQHCQKSAALLNLVKNGNFCSTQRKINTCSILPKISIFANFV